MPNGKQVFRPLSRPGAPPKTVFATEVNLTRVLDLSTDEIQRALRTDSAELAQPWKARKMPLAQKLGLACFASGHFSALRYRSTKAAPSYCLAVFPSRMNPEEYVSVLDPQEFFSQIPLAKRKETFQKQSTLRFLPPCCRRASEQPPFLPSWPEHS